MSALPLISSDPAIYPNICRQAQAVRESARRRYGFSYSERHLQCLWFDERLRPRKLVSTEGEELSVESPGRWNLEAGPDFLDATLLLGPNRRRISGDVEIHIHPSDWQAHGHSADPRYSRVIAHVSFFRASRGSDQVVPGAVQVCLKEILNSDPMFTFEAIDTTSYPYSPHATPTPCSAVLAGLQRPHVAHFLECAGRERLRIKAERMSASIRELGADQVFYEETMCALGYRDNRVPFRRLARALPLESLRSSSKNKPEAAFALLLGLSGLLPARISPRWDQETRAYLRNAWDFWWKAQSAWQHLAMQAVDWKLGGLRPQNHPVRRMAAAAAIFCGAAPFSEAVSTTSALDPAARISNARAALERVKPDAYWKRRLAFSRPPSGSDMAIVGEGRIAAIVSNVVVPFVAATGNESPDQIPGLELLHAEQESSIMKHAAFLLLRADRSPTLYHTALRQQGLLQVFHDFCLNDRTGCKACGLPNALRLWQPDEPSAAR